MMPQNHQDKLWMKEEYFEQRGFNIRSSLELKFSIALVDSINNQIEESQNQMEKSNQLRKYKKITYSDRLKLIELVCEQNHTCASAAKLYNFSPSTVKMIIKKYKEQGKVFEKKTDKERRELIQELEKKNKESSTAGNQAFPQNNPLYVYMPTFQPNMIYPNYPTMMFPPF